MAFPARRLLQALASWPLILALIGALLPAAASAATISEEIADGWSYFRRNDLTEAEICFRRAGAQLSPGAPEYPAARYGLANTLAFRRPTSDLDGARTAFRQAMDAAPSGPLAPWCELALVRIQATVAPGETPDWDAVVTGYRAIAAKYPQSLAADEATLRASAAEFLQPDLARVRVAANALEAYLVPRATSPFAPGLWQILAEARLRLGEPEKTVAALRAFLEAADATWQPSEFDRPGVIFKLATYAELKAGDLARAETYYRLFLATYPRDWRTLRCTEALTRIERVRTKGALGE